MGQQSANGVDRSEYRAGVYFAVVMQRLECDEVTTTILMRWRRASITIFPLQILLYLLNNETLRLHIRDFLKLNNFILDNV